LCSGFVCRYRVLPGGKRQVLNLVLPGDLIGFPTCFFENAINSLSSLTEVVVATVPFQAFYLILELLMRLRAVGLAEELSYSLPLTQELIADVLGLSGPHVSRMLRSLREEGLVTIEGHRLTVIDLESLTLLAGFDGDYLARSRIPGLRGDVGISDGRGDECAILSSTAALFIVGVAQLETVYADPERKIFQMNRLYVCGKVPWRPSGVSSPPNSSNAIRHAAPPQSYERAAETIPPTPRSSPLGPTDWLQSACRPAACGGRRRQKTPSRQK
jgi:hypothetical protein